MTAATHASVPKQGCTPPGQACLDASQDSSNRQPWPEQQHAAPYFTGMQAARVVSGAPGGHT